MTLSSAKLFIITFYLFGFSLFIHAQVENQPADLIVPDISLNQTAINAFESDDLANAETLFKKILGQHKSDLNSLRYLARIKARQAEMDDAENYLEQALKLAPNNAQVQNLSGRIYGSIAQDANMFSALSYAKKCLKGFTQAVELEPSNLEYRADLLSYHVNAPGIAGGDKDIAMTQALAIQQQDEKQGYLALLKVYAAQEINEKLQSHLKNLPQSIQLDPEVHFTVAMYEQSNEQYPQARLSLQQALKFAKNQPKIAFVKYSAMYQLAKTAVLSKQHVAEGLNLIQEYIAAKPQGKNLPSIEWAEFRLANLLELSADKLQAHAIYKKLINTTQDKELKKELKKRT